MGTAAEAGIDASFKDNFGTPAVLAPDPKTCELSVQRAPLSIQPDPNDLHEGPLRDVHDFAILTHAVSARCPTPAACQVIAAISSLASECYASFEALPEAPPPSLQSPRLRPPPGRSGPTG